MKNAGIFAFTLPFVFMEWCLNAGKSPLFSKIFEAFQIPEMPMLTSDLT
jgi:hypothetical protein